MLLLKGLSDPHQITSPFSLHLVNNNGAHHFLGLKTCGLVVIVIFLLLKIGGLTSHTFIKKLEGMKFAIKELNQQIFRNITSQRDSMMKKLSLIVSNFEKDPSLRHALIEEILSKSSFFPSVLMRKCDRQKCKSI